MNYQSQFDSEITDQHPSFHHSMSRSRSALNVSIYRNNIWGRRQKYAHDWL